MACIFLVIFLESYLQRLEFDLCALRSYFWQIHNVPVLCCEWSWLITISACISFYGSSLLSTKYNYLFEICLIQDMSWRTLMLRPEYCRKLAGQYHGWWCPGSMHCQVISSYDTCIDCVLCGYSSLSWVWISTTNEASMSKNDVKCKILWLC